MSNSGTMRLGLVNEMLPRVTWKRVAGEVDLAAFAKGHPARQATGSATVPLTRNARTGLEPPVVVVERADPAVSRRTGSAAAVRPSCRARRWRLAPAMRRAAISAGRLIGLVVDAALDADVAGQAPPRRTRAAASRAHRLRSAALPDTRAPRARLTAVKPPLSGVNPSSRNPPSSVSSAAVERLPRRLSNTDPLAVERDRAVQLGDEHARLADRHFGVGDVDAAVEDWRCEQLRRSRC